MTIKECDIAEVYISSVDLYSVKIIKRDGNVYTTSNNKKLLEILSSITDDDLSDISLLDSVFTLTELNDSKIFKKYGYLRKKKLKKYVQNTERK